MYPPPQGLNLDIDALSGICGSISIACWVVVFSPQIIENFRRSSADGLSLIFIIVWLLGDVFNILGAVLQGVIPTMTILAVYYTLADIVLLGQCFYYRGFTLSDAPTRSQAPPSLDEEATEESPLLAESPNPDNTTRLTPADADHVTPRSHSISSLHSHLTQVNGAHLSPATPLLPAPKAADPPALRNLKPTSTLSSIVFNASALLVVCAAGVFGWWLSARRPSQPPYHHHHHDQNHQHRHSSSSDSVAQDTDITFDTWGQLFGYLCAILYLGSRIPQLLLNYRRKSTEGVSMLFFLFACVGNLTYVMSIVAYEPNCAREQGVLEARPGDCSRGEFARQYGRYVLVNTSWLIGSAGTLVLDLGIFAQFWIYRGREAERGVRES